MGVSGGPRRVCRVIEVHSDRTGARRARHVPVEDHRQEHVMAKHCEICGKTPVVGRTLSHAHNVRARRFEPNLQVVRANVNGGTRRLRVCTRCIRSNKVVKVA